MVLVLVVLSSAPTPSLCPFSPRAPIARFRLQNILSFLASLPFYRVVFEESVVVGILHFVIFLDDS